MRLLFVTQVMDRKDKVLGAYHTWVSELAQKSESVTVICLYEGEHDLPANVSVYSLGKEKGKQSSIVYATRFFSLAWKLRNAYDSVFVHMNQEYIFIAGWLWKMLGKPIYMWRNHYAGSWRTDVAAAFCTKVFCTSKHSYTARYAKTVFMPVGIDLTRFHEDTNVQRVSNSILFLARMSPSKHPDVLIEALGLLAKNKETFTASFYGDPLPEDAIYYESLKTRVVELGIKDRITFHAGIPNSETPRVYQAHDIFVNCSQSGMFDKTLFEAAACGCLVVASSKDFAALAGENFFFADESESLAARLRQSLLQSQETLPFVRAKMIDMAKQQDLQHLVTELLSSMTNS